MTHSLNGKLFFQYQNNSVTALVSEDVLRDIDRRVELTNFEVAGRTGAVESAIREQMERDLTHLATTPIFTFVAFERLKGMPYITGSKTLLHRLQKYIQVNGGGVSVGRSFHVPFSNGPLNNSYRFVTNHRQFEDTFGITSAFLMKGVGEQE